MQLPWQQLLSTQRSGHQTRSEHDRRNPFETDLDRITFSTPFRRLKDKTQVHALPDNDHVRNRLTHSLETASVGRSLGVLAGDRLCDRSGHCEGLTPPHFGYVVQAACLAHDIGNPPFGHAGEDAIRSWFKQNSTVLADLTEPQRLDFLHFEGNAQGFRILTQLEYGRREGGLRLTHGVLAAFSKYPRSARPVTGLGAGQRKNGLYQSELDQFSQVAHTTGLRQVAQQAWQRHPMAYLMEAADDICYAPIDLEDGFELGWIPFDHIQALLAPIAQFEPRNRGSQLEQVRFLRTMAITKLIEAAVDQFVTHLPAIMQGTYPHTLLESSPLAQAVKTAKQAARHSIFNHEAVLLRIATGHRVLTGLLDMFYPVFMRLHQAAWQVQALPTYERHLAQLLGQDLLQTLQAQPTQDLYAALQTLTDTISAMTDGQAMRLFRRLNGIQL
ncbi:putative deoxyguanosinetriphosphate triphosphohydrolase [Magnetococcus marinus MC-1]|uniref:Putative deoxyguanosinetriphosphate triphosphohydrolase n=1 Tax=Magnetococcus marinus (strain ATCC BAA-1437 / JCM 17883 / MC-1) TaxID=156889 RepID=A0LDJ0_MAGMM|nr:deoxyguanosinetriphosphate triphosphohydrolase [Magnetococcus marinus]ABK46033.1 putative deoxyguanosinetriphosphate triphosphohydrolase [Magnetococcus marinus MC-1]